MAEDFMTPAQVANSVGLTTGRIYQLIHAGMVPYTRCLGRIRIKEDDWRAFLASQENNNRMVDQQRHDAQSGMAR